MTQALIFYGILLILLSFHEAGHAWVAHLRGDDTAKNAGRVTLNPLPHIDPVGTVLLPAAMLLLSGSLVGAPMFFGWAKPVPVNPRNLKRPDFDGVLIALAGPAANVILACLILPLAHLGEAAGWHWLSSIAVHGALISLLLCFFNLLPVPPLDGSHILKWATRMSDATYARLASFGFIIVLIAIQLPAVRWLVFTPTERTHLFLLRLYGLS